MYNRLPWSLKYHSYTSSLLILHLRAPGREKPIEAIKETQSSAESTENKYSTSISFVSDIYLCETMFPKFGHWLLTDSNPVSLCLLVHFHLASPISILLLGLEIGNCGPRSFADLNPITLLARDLTIPTVRVFQYGKSHLPSPGFRGFTCVFVRRSFATAGTGQFCQCVHLHCYCCQMVRR